LKFMSQEADKSPSGLRPPPLLVMPKLREGK